MRSEAERMAFLRSIVASPGDDLPRLVYADYLEESGGESEVAYAHFIRCQCELGEGDVADNPRYFELKKLELRLFGRIEKSYFTDSPTASIAMPLGRNSSSQSSGELFYLHRGFVGEVRLPLAAFLGGECERCIGTGDHLAPAENNIYEGTRWRERMRELRISTRCETCHGTGQRPSLGREIAESQPVEKWVLTDREVYDDLLNQGLVTYWFCEGAGTEPANTLPRELFALLDAKQIPSGRDEGSHKAYPTREAALSALSEACWLWANRPRIEREAEVRFVARDPEGGGRMTDALPFLKAIAASLEDDLPRLAYSDYLEEFGGREGEARAQVIRMGIELAGMPKAECERLKTREYSSYQPALSPPDWRGESSNDRAMYHLDGNPANNDPENLVRLTVPENLIVADFPQARCRCRPCSLKRKHDRYLASWGSEWAQKEVFRAPMSAFERRTLAIVEVGSNPGSQESRGRLDRMGAASEWFWLFALGRPEHYHRGFLRKISLPVAAFMEYGKRVAETTPVTEWVLSDRKSVLRVVGGREEWGWMSSPAPAQTVFPRDASASNALPSQLFGRLKGVVWAEYWKLYSSEAEANADLLAACVSWVRSPY